MRTSIVGYAARLPGADGADGAEAVWRVLRDGRCTVGDVPPDRWAASRFLSPEAAIRGHTVAARAALLDDAFDFDAQHFGISPGEAEQMDPQQRLLLETVAHAFDHAGIDPRELDPTRAGVFVGASSLDHALIPLQDPAVAGPYFMLGNTGSLLPNRISHCWDLHGPSVAIDTACSSGLVAFDHARRAIERGEIDVAVVGAVNLLLSPMPFVGFSQAGMLSPGGLCRPFADGADGYVRGEGAVAVVLERETSALAAGRRPRSTVVGSAVNTNGRTSGIALPSATRQLELFHRVQAEGGFASDELAFVEAHGTGTAVGDPREAEAIGRAYGADRGTPLPIGSAKSNFGHLEPAAGLVGVLKAQLALERSCLPPSLHCDEPNRDIDFAGLNLHLASTGRELPPNQRGWLGAINAFGFGGTNAHVVLRAAVSEAGAGGCGVRTAASPELPPALFLSASRPEALRSLAGSWRDRSKCATGPFGDRVASANWRRSWHRHRLCVEAGSPAALARNLEAWLADPDGADAAVQTESGLRDAEVAFVFSGNGAMWVEGVRQLLAADASFAEGFAAIADLFAAEPDIADPRLLLADPDLDAKLERVEVAQPLTFAFHVALTDALATVGLRPDAVLGHSLGEFSAAVAAGRLRREEAVSVIARRCRAFRPLHGTGGMLGMSASADRATELIAAHGLALDIAAENAPESVTVSGPLDDLDALRKIARERRIAARKLTIAYPYHGVAVEPLRESFLAGCTPLETLPSDIPFYSGWRGDRHDGPLDAEYWWQSARRAVLFRQGAEAIVRDGHRVLVEMSPRTVLRGYLRETLAAQSAETAIVEGPGGGRRVARPPATIARAALVAGARLDRERILGPRRPASDGLPAYPFQHKTYRLDSDGRIDVFARAPQHPLLGGRLRRDSAEWQGEILLSRLPWLADHRVDGRVLLPATAMLEIFAAAARQALGADAVELRDVEFLLPVEIPETDPLALRLVHEPSARRMRLETGGAGAWTTVAVARPFSAAETSPQRIEIASTADRAEGLYPALAERGLAYGPAFARLSHASRYGDAVVSRIAPRDPPAGFLFDPAAADAGLHGTALLLHARQGDGAPRTLVPARIDRVRVLRGAAIAGARVMPAGGGGESHAFDIELCDPGGDVALALSGLRLRPLPWRQSSAAACWDERLVPVAEGGADGVVAAADGVAAPDGREPTDADVLRGALGGRLAWDHAAASSSGLARVGLSAAEAAREELALRWLAANGHASTPEGADTPIVDGECPWPQLDDLVALIPRAAPHLNVELRAALAAAGREPPVADPLPALSRAMQDALGAREGSRIGRAALVGAVDAALLRRALDIADHVTVVAGDRKALAPLRAALAGIGPVRFAALDGLGARSVDLLVGVATTQVLSGGAAHRALARSVHPSGAALLAEEAPDIFALMTGRHSAPDAVSDVQGAFASEGVALEDRGGAGSECARILAGRPTSGRPGARGAWRVHGTGPMADGLRALADADGIETAAEVVVVAAPDDPLEEAALMRDLPAADALATGTSARGTSATGTSATGTPVWLVIEGTDSWERLSGWRRVAVNETGRDIRLVCHAPGTPVERVAAQVALSAEPELVLDGGNASAPRVFPLAEARREAGPRRLVVERRTPAMDGLRWRPVEERRLAEGEVEIDVDATGVNFRDVMWAQGHLPPEALEGGFSGPCLGMECAGRVRRAGAGAPFAAGERVVALAPHAYADRAVTGADAVMRVPDGIDTEAAAGLPVAFLTAEYGLGEVARLACGEIVLIHGGAGGVGLAALQVARARGARVFATAGRPAKRRLLRALGAEQVFDSRSLDFDHAVRAATDGRGVDVVVNSLAGEALERSLACLAPFGRFVEIGKRDLYENSAVGLYAMRHNCSFHVVDVDQLLRHRPDAARRAMDGLRRNFADGLYTALPVWVHEADDAAEALRRMRAAEHVGKLVVRAPGMSKLPTHAHRPAVQAAGIRGAWLVTGGTRGFGLETALWLARRGARHLWLLGRTGALAPEDAERFAGLGCTVSPLAADVADGAALARAVDTVAAGEDPLRGVVHAAARIDDVLLRDADPARLAAVLAPKIDGARHLDRLTRTAELDQFWLFSSVSARFGNPGQAAYVAANRALEALARRRHAEGRPALAIAWGAVGDTGYLARNADLRDAVDRQIGVMPAATALGHLGRLLDAGAPGPTVTIAPMEWGALADLPTVSSALFDLVDLCSARGAGATIDPRALLREHGPKKARRILTQLLSEEAASLMRMAPEEIDAHRPLALIGFDSLMAMNLRLSVEDRIGMPIPVGSIDDELTLASLVNRIVESVETEDPAPTADDAAAELARRHLARGAEADPVDVVVQVASKLQ